MKESYKVLWVENNPNIVEDTSIKAEFYNLELVHYENWQEAEIELGKNFYKYSAIILDAYCGVKKDEAEDSKFLSEVGIRMNTLFVKHHTALPWYIYSAGVMDNFNLIVSMANTTSRKDKEAEWGDLVYYKEREVDGKTDVDRLFEKIQKVAENSTVQNVLLKYKDVFDVLDGTEPVQINESVRKIMLNNLLQLQKNEVEDVLDIEKECNQLRQVVEHLFRAAHKLGCLPDEFFNNLGGECHVMVSESYKFLSGRENNLKITPLSPPMFKQKESSMLQVVLDITNSYSHTSDSPIYTEEEVKSLISIVVQSLCFVIKGFGKYELLHPDIEKNKEMLAKNTVREIPAERKIYYENNKFTLTHNGNAFVCEECLVDDSYSKLRGRTVKLVGVVANTRVNKDKYPYIATKVIPV